MEEYLINPDETIRTALKKMDESAVKTLYVHVNHLLKGAVSDGDIRRAILAGISLEEPVEKIMNIHPTSFDISAEREILKQTFLNKQFESIPLVNKNQEILKVIFWKHIFANEQQSLPELKNPVVVMAGGRGTRMKPFTHIFPKPLIPVGEKTMIEIIMDEFKKYKINDFYLTVNYKKELLKAYFSDSDYYKITFVDEPEFLGTAGSLKLLPRKFDTPFFVANCDILIKCDYSEIIDFHTKGDYALTLVASMRHLQIPYGVCEIETGGKLLKIDEKPQYDYLANTGLYVLNPDLVDFIPENKFFHITHLMELLKEKNFKIGVFPVSEKSWVDVGQWDQYNTALNFFRID